MNMKRQAGAAVAALLAASLGAGAHAQSVQLVSKPTGVTTISADPLEPDAPYSSPRGFTAPAGATSTYDFNFVVDSDYETSVTGAFTMTSSDDQFTSADLELFSGTATASNVSGTYIAGSDTGLFTPPVSKTSSALLAPGNYFVQTQVAVPQSARGPFNVGVSVVSKAPEPSTWLLMMAGLGAMGFALRRRRESLGLATA